MHIEADLPVSAVFFYGTYMRVDATKPKAHQLLTKAQKAFFDSAKEVKKLHFFKGHFSGTGKEKGIDVHLAVDLAVGAATGQFDEAIIMTGDADLQYCVQVARRFKKPVHLTAIGSRFPYGISFHAASRRVYDLDRFFIEHVLPTLKSKLKHLKVRELRHKIKIQHI